MSMIIKTIKTLNMSEAAKRMNLWKEDSSTYLENELDNDYKNMRMQFVREFDTINQNENKEYNKDYKFGLFLYKYMDESGFTVRQASNDDVWRFLSLCVIPDVIAKRWSKVSEDRYYKSSNRIWLKTIWWYIYLSFNESLERTEEIIKNNSTDEILNLVDRAGKKGYYVDLYRKIMYYYWIARNIDKDIGTKDFRRIMVLHTAMCCNTEPALCIGGVDGYVRMIFDKLGIKY